MKCPRCGADNDKVIDTRPSDEGRAIGAEESVLNVNTDIRQRREPKSSE